MDRANGSVSNGESTPHASDAERDFIAMAVWRTKACEMFGFAAIEHSYARGKLELFADLLELADKSADDPQTLDRIAEYVTWASRQTSDQLASAVDLAFWLPMFRNERIERLLRTRFSSELLGAKKTLLLDDAESTGL